MIGVKGQRSLYTEQSDDSSNTYKGSQNIGKNAKTVAKTSDTLYLELTMYTRY
jgi:hypothetical protein